MPDLRRREPVNVGVILLHGEAVLSRFIGQRADGSIDGRTARSWVASTQNLKRWVDYWRHAASRLDPSDGRLQGLEQVLGDSNYFLEVGGERLIGEEATDPNLLLEQLYVTLVEEMPSPREQDAAALADSVLDRLNIWTKIQRPYSFEIAVRGGVRSATDRVRFDYRYDNGRPNLMQRVTLTFEDERSWHSAHAASWAFARAYEKFKGELQTVALVRPRETDQDLEQQFRLLEAYAPVVDVSQADDAVAQLADLLHPA